MARICSNCRQPVDGNPREHDCPDDDLEPEGDGPDEAA